MTETKRTIQEVFDIENGEIINSKEFFKNPEADIFKYRRRLELAIQGYARRKFVCLFCNQPVKLCGLWTSRGTVSFFAHPYDSKDCEIKTSGDIRLSKKEIEILKYSKVRESERHKKLKKFIHDSLNQQISKRKGVSKVEVEKRITNQQPHYHWRQPDISFCYSNKRIVIELQLSTTFLSVIVGRERFYQMNNIFIIWVFNFSENQQYVDLQSMLCKDIYYSNKRNAFILDEEAMRLSEEIKELILKCVWFEPEVKNGRKNLKNIIQKEEYISIDQLKFDDVYSYKPYYKNADILFKHNSTDTIDEYFIEPTFNDNLNDLKLFAFKKSTQWGYKDESDTVIIPAVYFFLLSFKSIEP